MPGFSKMNRAGLVLIKELFIANPNMAFTRLTRIYNEEAGKRGWKQLRSSGTIGYHLGVMGLYGNRDRVPMPNNEFGKKLIKIKSGLSKAMQKEFSVSNVTVSAAMRYKTQTKLSKELRKYALTHGGDLYEIRKVENPYCETITL